MILFLVAMAIGSLLLSPILGILILLGAFILDVIFTVIGGLIVIISSIISALFNKNKK